jgi:outer membrane protein assembly factor BamA
MLPLMLHAIVLALTLLQQAPAAADSRIASVQVKGNRRYTAEEVTRLSGLQLGQAATAEDLTKAANRLASTGLFDSVRYTYTTGRTMTVTFEVEEAKWTMPVILDNFVWLPEPEIVAAIRAEVPSFDGTAPINEGAGDLIARTLQSLLKARGIPGRVEVSAQADLGGGQPKYLFVVKDPSPKVCAVRVSGASAVPEKDVVAPLEFTKGGDYSKFFFQTASAGTLTDVYRRKGFWRAKFDAPVVALNKCDGVDVTLPVTEGISYTWDHAAWSGNPTIAAAALDKALAMKPGEIADAGKIEAGLRDVRRLYGQQGYITAQTTLEPRVDDASRKAAFAIAVEEGAQFHMGTFQVEGVRESDAAMLAKKWKLKPGDVYDESYANKFHFEELSQLRTNTGGRPVLQNDVDTKSNIVNVRVVFK